MHSFCANACTKSVIGRTPGSAPDAHRHPGIHPRRPSPECPGHGCTRWPAAEPAPPSASMWRRGLVDRDAGSRGTRGGVRRARSTGAEVPTTMSRKRLSRQRALTAVSGIGGRGPAGQQASGARLGPRGVQTRNAIASRSAARRGAWGDCSGRPRRGNGAVSIRAARFRHSSRAEAHRECRPRPPPSPWAGTDEDTSGTSSLGRKPRRRTRGGGASHVEGSVALQVNVLSGQVTVFQFQQ